jgi:hypothetical protein
MIGDFTIPGSFSWLLRTIYIDQAWMNAVLGDDYLELHSFIADLRRGQDAVTGLSSPRAPSALAGFSRRSM